MCEYDFEGECNGMCEYDFEGDFRDVEGRCNLMQYMDTQLEHKAKKENSEVIKVLVEMKNDMAGMKNDMTGIKRRQDQVFQKQDIIHSTLAGEIPREHHSSSSGFRSFLFPSDVGFHSFVLQVNPEVSALFGLQVQHHLFVLQVQHHL